MSLFLILLLNCYLSRWGKLLSDRVVDDINVHKASVTRPTLLADIISLIGCFSFFFF